MVFANINRYFIKSCGTRYTLKTPWHRKKSCIALLKPIDQYYKILRLKSTNRFKEQTRIPFKLVIEKTKSSKEKQVRGTSANFNPYGYKVNKKATFQQKTPKSMHLWSNDFWYPIASVSVKVIYEKTSA